MPQQRLTDRVIAPYITGDTLIHIVNTGDTTQYAGGSSYKATIDQVATYISENYTMFSGGSGSCIADLYVSNIHSCSPLNINPLDEGNVYFGSTSAVTIDLVNERVGIGTTTPTEKLNVSGNTKIDIITTGNTGGLIINNISGSTRSQIVLKSDDTFLWRFGLTSGTGNTSFNFFNGTNDVLTINRELERVGIGVNPNTFGTQAKLHINNTTTGATFLAEDSTNPDSTPFVIDASGNVGIGISGTTFKLDVNGTTIHRDNVLISNSKEIFWSDTSTTWPTSINNRIRWTLNNDSAQVYAFQPVTDDVDFVFKITDNATDSRDNFVFWIEDFSGETFDRYPLEINSNEVIVNPTRRYALSASTSASSVTNFYVLKSGATSTSSSILHANTSTDRVGVNTSSPSETLDVNGKTKTINFQMTSGATTGYVLTSLDGNGNAKWLLPSVSADTNFANTDLTLTNNRSHNIDGNELYIYDSTGLNGTGPYLYFTTSANPYISIGYGNDSFLDIGETYGDTGFTFNTSGVARMKLDFNGNLGINTIAPTEKLDVSGKTKTINFQMTSGATSGYVLHSTDNNGNAKWGELSSLYTGNTSGDCITDLYISNIHSCSPLNINPLDEGNVYFGSTSAVTIDLSNNRVGIGTGSPFTRFDVIGQYAQLYVDTDRNSSLALIQPSERIYFGGNASGMTGINLGTESNVGVDIGQMGSLATNPNLGIFGNPYDTFIRSNSNANNLNIITSNGSGKEDSIRFYAKLLGNVSASTSSLHIQGSGTTKGYIGINNDNPTYRLHILGTTGRVFYDSDTTRNTYRQSQIINEGPSTGITAISVASEGSGNQIELFSIGSGVSNSVQWRFAGEPSDVALYASSAANNLNIMNNLGSGTTDNIRFYVGGSGHITGQTPAMIIIGSGTTKGYVGIGTTSPTAKLHVSGTSYFDTTALTTSTIPSFRLLDGVSTPTDTTNIKSFYKEFRPTTTSSNTVVTDGTIIYPNINSSTSAEFYASANLTFFTDDLSDLSSNEALTGEVNLVSIYTNTGTYNGIVKSSSAVLENAIAGGTIDKYVGFWANGLSADITHNGTTNNIYGFYMDNQSGKSGNVPAITNRYGVYIEDVGRNYFAGTVGIGTNAPSEKLDVSGKTKTINFQMTSGATSGYVLTSDASGNASWGSLYNKSTINISSATILGTLSAGSPVQLLPAPSLGKYYDWHAFVRYTYGTIAYNNSAGGFWYIEQGGADLSYGFNLNAITTNRTWKATEGSGAAELIGPSGFETSAINIRLGAATTNGDGTISVDIYYRELDL